MKYELTTDKFLSDEELAHLQDVIKKYPCRDSTLIATYIATGARASELLTITMKDLNPYKKTIYIRALKDSRSRWLPLPPELFDNVYQLAKDAPDGSPFPISYQRLVQIWGEYRPVKKGIKALRHTFGVQLYKRTKDLKLVQQALGHKWLSNTMIYVDFLYNEENLLRVLEYTDRK